MKKILLLSLLSTIGTATFAASNCSISYSTDDTLTAIIQKYHFEFDNYDAVCQRLKGANAKVSLMYHSFINTRQTTAVVIAKVSDKNLPIQSNLYNSAMSSDPERTTTIEKDLLMSAVNDVLNRITQEHIDSLNGNRKELGFKTYPASTNANKK